MGNYTPIPMDTRAPLDTSNPKTNLAPGTLVTAQDCGFRWWGPRKGSKQVAQANSLDPASTPPLVPGPMDSPLSFDGDQDYVQGIMSSVQQYDLPRSWTLDVVFRVDTIANTSGFSQIPIFRWSFTDFNPIDVSLNRTTAPYSEREILATIVPTSSPGVAGPSTILNSGTQYTVGTDPEDVHHVRVVRDGSTAKLIVNGTLVDTETGLNALRPHQAGSKEAFWSIGQVSDLNNISFSGTFFRALLRIGAYDDTTTGMHDFLLTRSKAVRLAIAGSSGAGEHALLVRDYSVYEAHGAVTGASVSGTPLVNPPFMAPIQGCSPFTDRQGRTWNFVMCGGTLYWQRVG